MKFILSALIMLASSNAMAFCSMNDTTCQQNEQMVRSMQDQAQAQQNANLQQMQQEREMQMERQRQENDTSQTQWINQ